MNFILKINQKETFFEKVGQHITSYNRIYFTKHHSSQNKPKSM